MKNFNQKMLLVALRDMAKDSLVADNKPVIVQGKLSEQFKKVVEEFKLTDDEFESDFTLSAVNPFARMLTGHKYDMQIQHISEEVLEHNEMSLDDFNIVDASEVEAKAQARIEKPYEQPYTQAIADLVKDYRISDRVVITAPESEEEKKALSISVVEFCGHIESLESDPNTETNLSSPDLTGFVISYGRLGCLTTDDFSDEDYEDEECFVIPFASVKALAE